MLNGSLYSSKKHDWSTPPELFDRLEGEFGFTLDACADANNHKCDIYYDVESDGLSRDWSGVVWMNPPFGRVIASWVKKAFESSRGGCTCVCLLPVRSDSRWWHDYVMRASEIRLLTRRLTFEGAGNKAPFPTAIVVFKPGNQTPTLKAMVV